MKWQPSWSLVGALGLCLGAGVIANACAATKPHDDFSTAGGNGGASASSAANGQGGAGAASTAQSGVVAVGSTGVGGSACSMPDPNIDFDMDGFSFAQGDCNDCDPSVNPDAVEVIAEPMPDAGVPVPADEDCDGNIDNVAPPCDTGLAQNSLDPMDGAKAVGFCDFVVGAKWVQADGSPPPAAPQTLANFHLGHGILDNFGQMNLPREGVRLLAVSSGTARKEGDPEFVHRNFDKGYTSNHPVGFPKESASCPGVMTLQPHDATGLEVEVRAPSNALSFSFDFNFFTYEWPGFICSVYNDFFLANLYPFPSMQMDGNISFDSQKNPISVNNAFLEACACPGGPPCSVPPTAPTKMFDCPLGSSPLVGTDFDKDDINTGWSHGSTTWLETTSPVTGGDVYKIRFVTYDSSDGNLDSLTLVDNFRWKAVPGSGTIQIPD